MWLVKGIGLDTCGINQSEEEHGDKIHDNDHDHDEGHRKAVGSGFFACVCGIIVPSPVVYSASFWDADLKGVRAVHRHSRFVVNVSNMESFYP